MLRRLLFAVSLFFALAASAAQAQFVNNSVLTLGDFQVGVAATQGGSPVLNLNGITALSCQVRFSYGSGGTTAQVYIQTSIDQGQSWFDIANVGFTTASGVEVVNLSGLNGVTTPTAPVNLALTNNTTFNGPLGDRLQAVVVSTGTYAGGTLASVRCSPR